MEMFNAFTLIPTIAAFRGEVVANRTASRSDFVCSLHDILVTELDKVTGSLHEEIETEKQFAAGKVTEAGDALYEIYHICTFFEHRWIKDGPISILDEIYVNIVAEGEACRVGMDYTLVPSEELDGLADILDRIRTQTGISFIVARV